ncbi:H-NS family nucleoid-associated regulatory protein [Rhodocyclus gracilis]|nr:H-NS histone family protein [Rhodocyclus gracilis]
MSDGRFTAQNFSVSVRSGKTVAGYQDVLFNGERLMSNLQDLIAQRDALDKQIEETRKAARAAAIAQVREWVAAHGLTAEDIGFKASGAAKAPAKLRKAVAIKYRGPAGETWTGRGVAPKWLTALESAGRTRSEFLVA